MGMDAVRPAADLAGPDEGAVPDDGASPDNGAPAWNRFAHWPRRRAATLLGAVLVLLVEAALVPLTVGRGQIATPPPLTAALGEHVGTGKLAVRARDDDLALYDAAIARIGKGENYYRFIVDAHRRARYPVRPGLAVRLPTLAYLDAWLGSSGQILAAVGLMLAVLWAWWQRLATEPGGLRHRHLAVALLFTSVALGLNRSFFVLHELWAGMLIALALGLHRPRNSPGGGKWLAAWGAAALALAIREHALPFVLLMAVFAVRRGAWREAEAWIGLIGMFVMGLSLHLHIIAAQARGSDPIGPSWMAWRGLGGWLSDVVLSSNLRFLPHWAAGPLVVLMILGWAGWRSPAGGFATLLYLGYGGTFMMAGRDDNFYWGAMIAPTMFIGLAFVPMAIGGLVAATFPHRSEN